MKNIPKHITFVFFLLCSLNMLIASPDDWYKKGIEQYNNAEYHDAIDTWLQIERSGFESFELYYNIGNAYFKSSDIPHALLYFERALKLAPGDEDVRFNIKIANLQIIDKVEDVPKLWIEVQWDCLIGKFSADEWAKATIIVFFFGFLFLVFKKMSNSRFWKPFNMSLSISFFVISVFTFIFADTQGSNMLKKNEAIVFTPTVSVKSSPDEKGIDIFVIHEGIKVKVTDQIGEWCEIRLSNGSVGWLRASDIKKI